MFKSFLTAILGLGPLHVVWLVYTGIGAIFFGVLSVPSTGIAILLVPLFILSGIVIEVSAFIACSRDPEKAQNIASVGLGILTFTAWGRGVALWGLDQEGTGSHVLASFVWSWLCVGFSIMLFGVRTKGIRNY